VRPTGVTDTFSGPLTGFVCLAQRFDVIAAKSVGFVRPVQQNDQFGRRPVGYVRLTQGAPGDWTGAWPGFGGGEAA
jgi:hypothetical protein